MLRLICGFRGFPMRALYSSQGMTRGVGGSFKYTGNIYILHDIFQTLKIYCTQYQTWKHRQEVAREMEAEIK